MFLRDASSASETKYLFIPPFDKECKMNEQTIDLHHQTSNEKTDIICLVNNLMTSPQILYPKSIVTWIQIWYIIDITRGI